MCTIEKQQKKKKKKKKKEVRERKEEKTAIRKESGLQLEREKKTTAQKTG